MIDARSYMYLLQMKRWHRALLTALLVGMITGVWWLFVHLSLQQKKATARMHIQQYHQQLDLCVQEQEVCCGLQEQVEKLKQEFVTHELVIRQCVGDAIVLLHTSAQSKSLDSISIKRHGFKRTDLHEHILISFQAKGTYHAIDAFMSSIKDARIYMQPVELRVERENGEIYTLYSVFKLLSCFIDVDQNKSPSTLEKS